MYHIVDNTRTVLNIYGIDYSLGYEQSWVSLDLCLRMPAFSRTEILTIIVFFFKRNTHVVPSNYKEIKTGTTLSQCLRGFEHGGEVESLVYTADKVLETSRQNKENKNQTKRNHHLKKKVSLNLKREK